MQIVEGLKDITRLATVIPCHLAHYSFELMSNDASICLLFNTVQVDRKSTAKVDYLKEIEGQIQKRWAENKTFETDAVLVRITQL